MSQEDRGLSSHLKDSLFPFNDEQPLGAGGKKTTMLLGIFSTNGKKYASRRSTVRETYLSIDDPRLCKLSEYKRQVEDNPNNVVCQVPYTFVIGAGDESRPHDHDDDQPLTVETVIDGSVDAEGDCTYLNIKENMEDGKSSTYFKFGASLATPYEIDYVAKIDDDSVLSPHLLLQLIEDDLPPAPFNRRHYGGSSWASYAKNMMYGAGQFYFMSSDLANYVGNSLSAKQRLSMMHSRHTEDGDMGAFIFSHPRPVKFLNLSNHAFWHHPRKEVDEFKSTWNDSMGGLPRRGGKVLMLSFLCPAWLNGKGL